MAVTITCETPLQDDVRSMVGALNDHLIPLSPREFQFQMTVEQMAGPETVLFVARDETGKAIGMGALKVHDGSFGEVKRMYTDPVVRGSGVGRKLLEAIEAEAQAQAICMQTADFTRAYDAFVAKRKPVFEGD